LQTPEAFVFGCEPDFNAWTRKMNPRPFVEDLSLRSCGGHVHVGTSLDKIGTIRAMDAFLGVPSIFIDTDVRRRALYGKAGAHRPKPYGVEYRTLSNFWLWEKQHKEWVYEQTAKALEFVEDGNEISRYRGMQIQQAINDGNKDAARKVMNYYGI